MVSAGNSGSSNSSSGSGSNGSSANLGFKTRKLKMSLMMSAFNLEVLPFVLSFLIRYE